MKACLDVYLYMKFSDTSTSANNPSTWLVHWAPIYLLEKGAEADKY